MPATPLHPRLILLCHILGAALVASTWTAVIFILPVIAKKQFNAGKTEILILTASPLVLSVVSVFWSHIYNRLSTPRYLALFWLITCAPAVAMGFAHSALGLIIPLLIMGLGNPAWPPLNGDYFKRLYPNASIGKLYGVVAFGSGIIGATAALGMGEVLSTNPESFRLVLPGAAVLQLLGVLVMLFLWKSTHQTRALAPKRPGSIKQLIEPVTHMTSVLKADPIFARYEGAYMTYGIGWMICWALVPLFVTEKLDLQYDQISRSVYAIYTFALVCAMLPAGRLMDKLGAVRSTGLSFLLLAVHPLGLMLVQGEHSLFVVSLLYGIAHAGANVGWLLGPVSLAPSPDKVPAYVAIHATLVGIRGALFQLLGVGLYKLTGSFIPAFAIAAAAYIWSAIQMWQLDKRMRAP